MNVGDSNRHYIRIQKAYYDENTSALVLAKDSNANLWASLDVHLRELTDTSSKATILSDETLQSVDLNQEGFIKDDAGIFFSQPNRAYKSTRTLNSDHAYRIVIINSTTGEKDSAATMIIPNSAPGFDVPVFNPSGPFSIVLDFSKTSSPVPFRLEFPYPYNSQFCEGTIRVHYVDKTASGQQSDSSVDWLFGQAVRDPTKVQVSFTTPNSSFYDFLNTVIGSAPSGVTRYMDTAEIFIWAGSPEFYKYKQINSAQGGITADQIKPIYTNLQGANVYGLFASRAMRRRTAPFSDATLDTLMARLPNLNFHGRSDH